MVSENRSIPNSSPAAFAHSKKPSVISCFVVGHWVVYSESLRRQGTRIRALADQVIADCAGAFFEERLIELGRTGRIRVAFDCETER